MKKTRAVSVRVEKDLKDEIMDLLNKKHMTFSKVFKAKVENMIKREIKKLKGE